VLYNLLKRNKDKNLILIGDFNIAHQEIDLARPRDNQKNIMFTERERKQIDKIVQLGFTGTFREFNQKKRKLHLVAILQELQRKKPWLAH